MLRIGWKDVAKVFRENAEISKLLTASAIFVFKKFPPIASVGENAIACKIPSKEPTSFPILLTASSTSDWSSISIEYTFISSESLFTALSVMRRPLPKPVATTVAPFSIAIFADA